MNSPMAYCCTKSQKYSNIEGDVDGFGEAEWIQIGDRILLSTGQLHIY